MMHCVSLKKIFFWRLKVLFSDNSEGTARQMLPVPLAADHGFSRLWYIVWDTEGEIPVVLHWDKLHRNVCTTHTHFQETTPASIATVDSETARVLQPLDETFRGIWRRAYTLDFKWATRHILVCKFEIDCVNPWFCCCVGHLSEDKGKRERNGWLMWHVANLKQNKNNLQWNLDPD